MTDAEIGTLDQISVRDVWPKEDRDFTPWLAENVDLMSDALGMELELEGQEVSVGGYSADLVLNDISTDSRVVVENMYGSTDHDHIGKLITYAAGLDAQYAVLVSENFRPEHRSALNWLNSVSTEDCGFFGLGLEVWRIGDSSPAPKLRVEVRPDDWHKNVRASKTHQGSERPSLYYQFWDGFLPKLHEAQDQWRRTRRPQRSSWMSFKSANQSVAYIAAFTRPGGTRLLAQAYIDTGNKDSTADFFEYLLERRGDIERTFGGELIWSRVEHARYSSVAAEFPEQISVQDKDRWPQAWEWLVPTLGRLRDAIDPEIDGL